MRPYVAIVLLGWVLMGWGSQGMAEDFPPAVQTVLDKQASGGQLTPAEMNILSTYLSIDQLKTQLLDETDTQWGPDGFGYSAIGDYPSYSWYDNTTFGTEFWAGEDRDNDWTSSISLPFSFPFYGYNENDIYISANGIIGFTMYPPPEYQLPVPSLATTRRIDPWVYDMYHLGSASHYYYQAYSDTMFSVSFMDIRYQDSTYRNDPNYSHQFQVLLFSDGRIKIQYKRVWSQIPASPYNSGIDDNWGPYGLTWGNYFDTHWAITFYPPSDIYLSNPSVDPITGGTTTDFYYYVTYRNGYGLAPNVKQVFIDGTPYTMHDPGGNYQTGVTFDYGPVNLLEQDHDYYFSFALGPRTARLPSAGSYVGPVVTTPRTLPYYEYFDMDNGDFASSDPNVWQWGDPVYSAPYSTQSEPNCWGTVIDGEYPIDACASLITPPIILEPNTKLSFYHWYYLGAGYVDGGNVKISTDNGTSWSIITPSGGYPDIIQPYNACIVGEPGYAAYQPYWNIATFDLSAYANQTAYIKWEFGSNYIMGYDGWFIDNVVVASEDYCVALSPETQDDSGARCDTVDYTVHIQNCGMYNDTYDLTANVTGEPWQTEIWNRNLTSQIDSIALALGVIDSLIVRVVIPTNAAYPDTSTAQITATSRYGTARNTLFSSTYLTTHTYMAGTYDVAGGNNDFPNPVSAASTLESIGIMAPTTFNVYSGTYNGQVEIPYTIIGMGASNPITFQNAPGEHPIITSPSGQGFNLLGADYITIQGFEIANCHYNGIHNVLSGSDSSTHNAFISNYIHNVGSAGILSGIRLVKGHHCRVSRNEVDGDYVGIFSSEGHHNLIDNNMIYNTQYYCIENNNSHHDEIIYNSCYISTIDEGSAFHSDWCTDSFVKNNIFYQAGTGYAYYFGWDFSGFQSDYNDIYAPNGFVGYYFGNLTTLANFQTSTGLDANSISADPYFISTTDLHIDTLTSSPVDSAGIPIIGITTDFDGDLRDPVTPDIGADEFELVGPPDAIQDLVITMWDTMSYLQWSPVSGAVQYHIYKSTTDPQSGFILLDSTTNTSYTDSTAIIANNNSYYYVTSDNQLPGASATRYAPRFHMPNSQVNSE